MPLMTVIDDNYQIIVLSLQLQSFCGSFSHCTLYIGTEKEISYTYFSFLNTMNFGNMVDVGFGESVFL